MEDKANQVEVTAVRKVWLADSLESLRNPSCCEWCREQFPTHHRHVWVKGTSRAFCSEACACQEDLWDGD